MSNKKEKVALVLNYSMKEVFEECTPEQAQELIIAMIDYDKNGIVPDFSDTAMKFLWIPIRQDLDKKRQNHKETSIKRAAAGAQGGRGNKKADDEMQFVLEESNKSNCFTEKQTEANEAKKAEYDCDCECDSDCENKKDIPPAGGEPCGSHQSIYDHYLTLGLIKHKALSREMINAIDIARRRGGFTWEQLKTMLGRHAQIVKLTASNGEFAVRPRGITEFFGQKVKDGTALICSEYADDGAKWQLYKNGNPHKPRSDTPKQPKKAHFEREFTEEDSKRLEERFMQDFWDDVDKRAAAGGNTS